MLEKKGPSNFEKMAVFAFGYTVLLRCVDTRCFMDDPSCIEELRECGVCIILSIIRAKTFNETSELGFYHLNKVDDNGYRF